MDWFYTKESIQKYHQNSKGVGFTRETEERAPHTELEENTIGRAESENLYGDAMQENGNKQDDIKQWMTYVPSWNEEGKETEKQ